MTQTFGFDDSLKTTLVFEGGKVDDKQDPGGRTNNGVTQATYNAWRRNQDLPTRDVYLMDATERASIYKLQYWDHIKGDFLRPGVNLILFDGAVHSGTAQSIKWGQRAAGITPDGIMGEKTFNAIKSVNDDDAFIARYMDSRRLFLRHLKTFGRFGKGWMSRCDQVQRIGQQWASGSVGPTPSWVDGMHVKALLQDAKPPPYTAPADAVASGGAVSVVLSQATNALAPLDFVEGIGHTVAVITAAGALAGIAAGAYGQWARKRAAERADALGISVPATADPAPVQSETITSAQDAPAAKGP